MYNCGAAQTIGPWIWALIHLKAWARILYVIPDSVTSHNRENPHTAAYMQFDEAECCCTSRCLGNNKSERNWVMIQELLLLLLSSCRMLVWSVSWECAESREVLPSASQAPIQQLHSLQCILHCRYNVEWGEGVGGGWGAQWERREAGSLREAEEVWKCARLCGICVRETVWKCGGQ